MCVVGKCVSNIDGFYRRSGGGGGAHWSCICAEIVFDEVNLAQFILVVFGAVHKHSSVAIQ